MKVRTNSRIYKFATWTTNEGYTPEDGCSLLLGILASIIVLLGTAIVIFSLCTAAGASVFYFIGVPETGTILYSIALIASGAASIFFLSTLAYLFRKVFMKICKSITIEPA